MNYEIFEALLDQAEHDFRAEAAEIELIADPTMRERDRTSEPDGAGQHPADLASDLVEREIASGILMQADEMLSEIRDARARLTAGTYGRCESCGRTIDLERLRAVPWARRCAPHERAREAESRGYELDADSSSWLPGEPDAEDTSQDILWDAEDDHPDVSAEESAVHEMIPRNT